MPCMESTIDLHINHSGAGPAVVYTHGWIDTSTAWDGVVAAMDDSATNTIWDLRGHGDSEIVPAGQYTRDHALADLARVVDEAGAPVVLAGHSLGGYLSLAYALLHPENVRGLVLVAAGPGFRKDEAREQWNDSVDISAEKFAVPEGSEVISKHTDSWVIDHLEDIKAPTLVIVGEHDKRFAASAAVFEKYLDVKASVVIPDAGHGVHKKHGTPVAAAIKDFLAGLGA